MAIRTLKAFLYHNKSDERYVNKELVQLHPTDGEPVDGIPCILKDDTDLIRPTLIFNYHLVPNVNYIWLSEVARYYYVRNRTYSQERIYVHCEEDVLYTYRNELKKYVDRVVTFSSDDNIFGINTIRIINGIDISTV